MDTGLSSEYVSNLKAESDDIASYILAGKCKDYETYRHKIGIMQGINRAEQCLHDTIKKLVDLQELRDEGD